MSNKSYAYLLTVEPSDLVYSKAYTTEFEEFIMTFTDQNERELEIEDKFNLTLLIYKNEMSRYSIELRTRKHVKG